MLYAIANKIDFLHHNLMWRYYELSVQERTTKNLAGLTEYLPSDDNANRDIGAFNKADQVMRFVAKHNDIYPLLGDLV